MADLWLGTWPSLASFGTAPARRIHEIMQNDWKVLRGGKCSQIFYLGHSYWEISQYLTYVLLYMGKIDTNAGASKMLGCLPNMGYV